MFCFFCLVLSLSWCIASLSLIVVFSLPSLFTAQEPLEQCQTSLEHSKQWPRGGSSIRSSSKQRRRFHQPYQHHNHHRLLHKLRQDCQTPCGHAGPPEQCERDGHDSLLGRHRLCSGPVAGAGATQRSGQERRLCGGPTLLQLPARLWSPGAPQSCYVQGHQRGQAGR